MANHDELYNGNKLLLDGSFIRHPSFKDIVCPGTSVFFSELNVGGAMVGQVVTESSGPIIQPLGRLKSIILSSLS